MEYRTFTKAVARRARLREETAAVIERAALRTLAERIGGAKAHDLAEQLPDALRENLSSVHGPAEPFDVDEFVRRVMRRTGASRRDAWDGLLAVLSTVLDAVGPGAFDHALFPLRSRYTGIWFSA